ncbi:MAG: hypothetical protein KGM98_10655 [Bacteroidota bacterium]|nr:hypothetical protein [Bacteroidota bacterium]
MKKSLQDLWIRGLLLITLSVFFAFSGTSQSLMFGNGPTQIEAGINVGPMFFLGDLGGHAGKGTPFLKDLNLPLTKVDKGLFVTVYPNSWFGLRFAVDFGKMDGFDSIINTKGVNELWRKQRNLDFRTNISEGYVAAEIYPIMFLNKEFDDFKPRFRPYGVIGIGLFHFNPQGSLTTNGVTKWYYLKPLHTEGEGFAEYPNRKNYALTQVNIPMGIGFKYFLSDRVNVGMEILYRKTFTDYIDDVSTTYIDPTLFYKYLSPQNAAIATAISDKTIGIVTPGVTRYSPGTQRGDPSQKDAYFSVGLKFAMRLGPIFDNMYDRRVASHMRCPSIY